MNPLGRGHSKILDGLSNGIKDGVEAKRGDLEFPITERTLNGDFALHVHLGVNIGREKPVSTDIYFAYVVDNSIFNLDQSGFAPPCDSFMGLPRIGERFLDMQGAMLVSVRDHGEGGQVLRTRLDAIVRLRLLNDFPGLPVDWDAEKWAFVRHLRLANRNREFVRCFVKGKAFFLVGSCCVSDEAMSQMA